MTNQRFFSLLKCSIAGILLMVFAGCDKTPTDQPTQELKNPDKAVSASYCTDEISGGLTTSSTAIADYGAAVDMTVDMLKAKGTHIVGVRVAIMNEASDCELFISRGLDQTPIATKAFTPIVGNWTYIALDAPILIEGESNIYFGYTMKSSGGGMGYQSSNRSSSNDHIFFNNGWTTLSENKITGRMSVQAMIAGGDYDEKFDLGVSEITASAYAKIATKQQFSCFISNLGNTAVESYTINYAYGEETGSVTISEKLMASAMYQFISPEFTASSTPTEVTLSVSVVANNVSDAVAKNNSASTKQIVYENGYPRTMMIEQFTGQSCGNCPGGTSTMKTNLANYLDNVVWAAHHVGYGNDDFTVSKSSSYTVFYNANGTYAPAMMIDRTRVKEIGDPGPVSHPAYFSASIAQQLSEIPAFVTLEIEREFNFADSMLSMTINGEFAMSITNPRMNVFIIQDSIIAYQSGGGNSYVHNRAVRDIITPAWGDDITVEDDGTFSMTYSYHVADTIGKFASVLKNMEVQAFVTSHGSDVNSRQVMNATKKVLLPEEYSLNRGTFKLL